jgi:hypothetical protein
LSVSWSAIFSSKAGSKTWPKFSSSRRDTGRRKVQSAADGREDGHRRRGVRRQYPVGVCQCLHDRLQRLVWLRDHPFLFAEPLLQPFAGRADAHADPKPRWSII